MTKRLAPRGDHQPDLFAANYADIPIRDQRDTMERPFLSLAKPVLVLLRSSMGTNS